jgi:hypothetical protein
MGDIFAIFWLLVTASFVYLFVDYICNMSCPSMSLCDLLIYLKVVIHAEGRLLDHGGRLESYPRLLLYVYGLETQSQC